MERTREILYFQEFERRRIAEELHDTTAQELVHLSQQLELAYLYMDQDIIQAKLEMLSAKKQIKSIISGIRDTIYDLRPMTLDDIGWRASVSSFYDTLVRDNDINVHFDIDDLDIDDGVTAVSIYRIMCESCQNILKHSHAKNMWVSIKADDNCIRLKIRDDGIGFQEKDEDNHFGMQFMRERVFFLSGIINVETGYDGTEIFIEIPIKISNEHCLSEKNKEIQISGKEMKHEKGR